MLTKQALTSCNWPVTTNWFLKSVEVLKYWCPLRHFLKKHLKKHLIPTWHGTSEPHNVFPCHIESSFRLKRDDYCRMQPKKITITCAAYLYEKYSSRKILSKWCKGINFQDHSRQKRGWYIIYIYISQFHMWKLLLYKMVDLVVDGNCT